MCIMQQLLCVKILQQDSECTAVELIIVAKGSLSSLACESDLRPSAKNAD